MNRRDFLANNDQAYMEGLVGEQIDGLQTAVQDLQKKVKTHLGDVHDTRFSDVYGLLQSMRTCSDAQAFQAMSLSMQSQLYDIASTSVSKSPNFKADLDSINAEADMELDKNGLSC